MANQRNSTETVGVIDTQALAKTHQEAEQHITPVTVWLFRSDRMGRAQEAKRTRGHVALAKRRKRKFSAGTEHQSNTPLATKAAATIVHRRYPINEALTLSINISDSSVTLSQLDRSQLPHCPKCDSLMGPSVVFFGEAISSVLTEARHSFIVA
ncbi:hypothetical protein EJ02DRAFT_473886 [Clathrospora elynae]|uniref:Uncharacterized protein n=1 Tax=Clathrospora elynae TaxID=706981 RepID=A0A6A5SCS5_9PLEO|nr:hypothetical protein EJ02DRAFT_473886 [Clathrospora elynae]